MPVDLSVLPPKITPDARPPRPVVWLLLAVIVIGGGVALALWLWPKGKSTHDWQFWAWLVVVPSLVYALLFAVRWHVYEQALTQVEAYNRQREDVVNHNTVFAQRPLALLAHAYVTTMGERDVAKRIMRRETALAFRPVRGIGASVSHTSIVSQQPEARETERRRTYRDALPLTNDNLLELFGRLISQLQSKLVALPSRLVLPVQLVVTGSEYPLNAAKQWETAWKAFGLGEFVLNSRPAEIGLMALDAWLDETDRQQRERVTLYVNIQLRDDPPDNGAEATTAMLVAWPDVVKRIGLSAEAWLQRPVRAPAKNSATTLETALTWGNIASVDDTQVWASGLHAEGRESLSHAFRQSPTAAPNLSEEAVVTANIDTSLGDAGHTAGWLACALAAECLQASDQPQLIATQEPSGVAYAVVRKFFQTNPEPERHS